MAGLDAYYSKTRAHLATARAVDVGVGILGVQADAWALARSSMAGSGLVERQLLCNGCEELGDVLGSLGRGLEEQQTSLLRIGLGIGGGDRSLVGLFVDQIQLVARQSDDDVLVRLSLELLNPRFRLV